ncbi:MAG TPA: hypothetical protein VFA43_04675 [Gemmatimonadaceae bacterium]|nr:hypothetical protein [Gemmatimonadaceae bacterium]
MPGFVYLDLSHNAARELRGRGQVRQMFQRLDHFTLLLERRAALLALAQVRLEGGDTETGFAVQELVDLVGE